MFQWIKQRSTQRQVAHQLYGSIVSQARQPVFYRSFDVPDDIAGRFELICLHLFGVLERLGAAEAGESVGRDLIERFFTDMDDIMREMGVGDTTVPKRMRTA
ncbi:MAG: ubiquinol-cytochrome C chaperone family protein, partial [Hyphomicrobiaceae bacterium]